MFYSYHSLIFFSILFSRDEAAFYKRYYTYILLFTFITLVAMSITGIMRTFAPSNVYDQLAGIQDALESCGEELLSAGWMDRPLDDGAAGAGEELLFINIRG